VRQKKRAERSNVGILHQNYFDKLDTSLSRMWTFSLLIQRVLRYMITKSSNDFTLVSDEFFVVLVLWLLVLED
jgi:hypothetical protein